MVIENHSSPQKQFPDNRRCLSSSLCHSWLTKEVPTIAEVADEVSQYRGGSSNIRGGGPSDRQERINAEAQSKLRAQ